MTAGPDVVVRSHPPRRRRFPKLDVYTDPVVRAWIKLVPDGDGLAFESCSFAAVSYATPLVWDPPPLEAGKLPPPGPPVPRAGPDAHYPAWLEWELSEGGGWDSLLGVDPTYDRGFDDRARWALENGVAPGQSFLVEVEKPIYPSNRGRWLFEYDDSGPDYGEWSILDRYAWPPEKTLRAWERLLRVRAEVEAQRAARETCLAARARHDRRGWAVRVSPGWSSYRDDSPPDLENVSLEWRGPGREVVILAAWHGPGSSDPAGEISLAALRQGLSLSRAEATTLLGGRRLAA